MKTKISQLAFAIASIALCNVATAGTASGTLAVSATISGGCLFSTAAVSALPFGMLTLTDLVNGKNEVIPATVIITCVSSATTAKLYGDASRQMTDIASNLLTYEVYTDGSRTTPLGSSAATGQTVPANGLPQTITLYGKTTAGQGTKPAGVYAQTLALTVDF